MARPKVRGKRRGGRNAQFFESLSGLARGLDKAIADSSSKQPENPALAAQEMARTAKEKQDEAEAKRKRKAYARLKAAGLLKGE